MLEKVGKWYIFWKRKAVFSNEATGNPGKYDTVASALDICEIVNCYNYAQVKVSTYFLVTLAN